MNKKSIWAIVILMSVSLLGIAITQFIWIKAQVDLDEKHFDDKVIMAMNNVKQSLLEDTEQLEFVKTFFEEKKQTKRLFGKEKRTPTRGEEPRKTPPRGEEPRGRSQGKG